MSLPCHNSAASLVHCRKSFPRSRLRNQADELIVRAFAIGDRLGRLWWGRIMCSIWLMGIIVYTTSVGNLGQMYAGKFVVGIGLGQMPVIAPAYLAVSNHFGSGRTDRNTMLTAGVLGVRPCE